MSLHRRSSFTALVAILLTSSACVVGCGGGSSAGGEGDFDSGDLEDGGGDGSPTDGARDGAADGSSDVAKDGAGDATSDGTTDGESDGTAEASSDGTSDVGSDGSADASSDEGTDTAILDSGKIDTGTPDTAPPDPCVAGLTCSDDADGDTIPDSVEGRCTTVDTDSDGTPDYRDLDSDNDSIADKLEWAAGGCDETAPFNDADGDGIPNFRDLDSDANGLNDSFEICPPAAVLTKLGKPACTAATGYDFDGDGVMDFLDNDNDHDSPSAALEVGLEDKHELANNAGVYVGLGIDSDSDGVPDVYDIDSDDDFIFDLTDSLADTDADGVPNYRDKDSDGDSVPDACEARGKSAPVAADLTVAVKDTDFDGKPDYLDVDSDSDLLVDGREDKNFNCIVDACESSRVLKDTDADGTDDFIESTLDTGGACWASDGTKDPHKGGKFYFLEPYSADGSLSPTPTTSPLALTADLQKGDLGIVMDTTLSMQPEFDNLKTNLPTIIDQLKVKLPDLGVGIAGADDFPTSTAASTTNTFGSCVTVTGVPVIDDPYYQLTAITTVKATAIAAVAGLRQGNGQDLPEDQGVALNYAITGNAFAWPSLNGCAAGSRPAVAASTTNFGAMRFREGALPILMNVSDAEFHNGIHATAQMPHIVLASPTTVNTTLSWISYDAGSNIQRYYLDSVEPYSFAVPSITDLATALKAKGARFIGGSADDARGVKSPPSASPPNTNYYSGPASGVFGTAGALSAARNETYDLSPFGDMAYLVRQTGSYVPPSAFTHTASCTAAQCCTGFNGAGVAPDGPGGTCLLVFNVNHNGSGLGQSLVDSVVALIAAIKFDVHVQASPTAGEPYDAVDNFMTAIQPSLSGGTDPVTGSTCLTISGTADRYHTPKALTGAGDIAETALAIDPKVGNYYCFNVIPKANVTVAATTSVQVFHASLQVIAENGSGTIPLGTPREVLFIVPPLVN